MIVSNEKATTDWLAWTGVETVFPCGFQALDSTHVFGEYRANATQVVTAITINVDFTVFRDPAGMVTAFPIKPHLPAGPGALRFFRQTPALKSVDFINLGSYAPEIHDFYYSADVLRDSELRRDIGSGGIGTGGGAVGAGIAADQVAYPGPEVGLAANNVETALDLLVTRGLARLPDVAMPVLNVSVDQWRVAFDYSSGKFILHAPDTMSGPQIVAAINTELGGTVWQGGGSGGGGEINVGSNLGSGGAIGVYASKTGVQLQFYGVRGLSGVKTILNLSSNSVDFSLDTVFSDARYVTAAALAAVAFTGAYASLTGKPSLGGLAAKSQIDFSDILSTAIATLADAQAGTVTNKLMTPQRVAQAIAALGISASRNILAGQGLTGGGNLAADMTLNIGTPTTVSTGAANAVTADSHSHALLVTAADVVPGIIGAIGSYGFCFNVGPTVIQGATTAGSNLRYSNTSDEQTPGPPAGTWRNMGGICGAEATLFVRIA